MKKRLLLVQFFITFAGTMLDASFPQEYAALSKVYNERFTSQVDQSATIGISGTLDDTFNETEGSIGSIDLSAQLSGGRAQAVVALPNSNFLVAMSVNGVNSNIGMYNSEGTLQISSYNALGTTPGIVDLGAHSGMVQSMIVDAQGRAILVGGDGTAASGWLKRVQADGSSTEAFVFGQTSPWSLIAGVATQSTGNIMIVGSNGTHAMIARYHVGGGIDTTFGTDGYIILNGSGQLPNSATGIFSVVVDNQDRIYIPYFDTDNTVWIIRLLANGTPDASWFSSFYGGMTRVGYATTVGTLTTNSSNTGVYHTASSLNNPSSGTATFAVGSGSPYYSGNLSTTSDNNGNFTLSSGSFITNRVAVPDLNGATAEQIRMSLDVNDNLIIAAQVGNNIKLVGIQISDGSAAALDLFNSSVITTDQLNLYSLITTQDNSILLAGSDAYTGYNIVIKLIGSNIYPGAGSLDTTFNGSGYNFYQSNTASTAGAIANICLSPDGRIYAANYQTIALVDYPYLSRLYNILYDSQTAQFPETQEQGIVDLSFGDNATQTYRGVINPYFGSYRGNLQQKGQAIIESAVNMKHGFGSQDLVAITNGFLNNSSNKSFILNWFTPSGQIDTNFGTSGSGSLLCNNITSSDEIINGMAQGSDGSIYVAGTSGSGPILRRYTQDSTSNWTHGNEEWAQTFSIYTAGQGCAVVLQGTGRALLFGHDQNSHGFIVAYDQMTGHIANGVSGSSVFGDHGNGYIDYNSYNLYMGKIYSAVVNDAGDIFVAYQNFDPAYVNIVGFKPDGSGLISQFGTDGVFGNLFTPFPVNQTGVRIAQANTGNLLVCAADDNNIYLARLDGVTGQLDTTFHVTDEGAGVVIIPLANSEIFQLQGISDGSILITGSCNGNAVVVITPISPSFVF